MLKDMKVIDKGLQGKGHKIPFIKLVGEDGSTLKLVLESKSQLDDYQIEDELTIRLNQEQQKLASSG